MTLDSSGPQNIFLIEDNRDMQDLVVELLVTEGYSVTVAADGQAALERMKRTPEPALIVLDLAMPVLDGWGFLKAQQADERLARVPVLIFTASHTGEEARAEYPSVRGVVGKLVDPKRLLAAVRLHANPLG